ncbi:MAG TPA: hypothetical protein PKA58_20110 [Polyangium sp.]|jgi:hypothetical protein|nr:hypothetical protein [Polyangium sp.]
MLRQTIPVSLFVILLAANALAVGPLVLGGEFAIDISRWNSSSYGPMPSLRARVGYRF